MAKPVAGIKNRRLKGRSDSADTRKKQVYGSDRKAAQLTWRVGCLNIRKAENRLTDKNLKELTNLAL